LTSRKVGQRLDNFDDKVEAALEEELTREVFENSDEEDSVKINSGGDAKDFLGVVCKK